MPSENPFRLALLAVIVLNLAVAVTYRLRAASSGERISHREEGYLFAVVLRLLGVGMWIGTFGYLLFPASWQWASLPLPTWLRWCGVVVGLMSAPLLYWTLSCLGRNLTDTVVTRAKATLVTHGPYRWVRHPFYVATGLLMAAVAVLTANWFVAASCFLVLAMLIVRTPREEAKLIERFGDDYRQYMSVTGRFFPKFWK